jgi:hypothetical protein
VAAAPPATRTLAAHQEAVIARMKNGDATAMIARDLAAQTGVPQEQAMQFVTETFRAHRDTIMS